MSIMLDASRSASSTSFVAPGRRLDRRGLFATLAGFLALPFSGRRAWADTLTPADFGEAFAVDALDAFEKARATFTAFEGVMLADDLFSHPVASVAFDAYQTAEETAVKALALLHGVPAAEDLDALADELPDAVNACPFRHRGHVYAIRVADSTPYLTRDGQTFFASRV